MKQQPEVKPRDLITVNKGTMNSWNDVVCSLDPISSKYPDSIEVVYLDLRGLAWQKKPSERKALQTYVVWKSDMWQRAYPYPNEGYADNYSGLTKFVKILRRKSHIEF